MPHPHLPRLWAFCRMGLLAAKSDGRIAASERAAIRRILGEMFGHDPVLVRHLDPVMERVAKEPLPEAEVMAAIRAVIEPEERLRVYRMAEQVADAAGPRNERETAFLERLRQNLEIDAASFEKAVSAGRPLPFGPSTPVSGPGSVAAARAAPPPWPPIPTPADPRTVLEIPPDVEITAELVRRRYNLLMDRLDPARAQAMGPDIVQVVEAKRAAVTAAAEALLKPLGESLTPPAKPSPPQDLRHNPDLDSVFGV